MRFLPLASSSSGNAYVLEDGASKLLIECGLTFRKLQKLSGFRLSGLSGCLISHEHRDHSGCYLRLLRSGIPVFSGRGTADTLEHGSLIQILEPGKTVSAGSYDVLPFPVFHDAAEPLGFLIRSRADGERLVFATDTVNLNYQFLNIQIVAIECNYDEETLSRANHLPDRVRRRIQNAHMSVSRTCAWLEQLDKSGLREIYLIHLSDTCSNEQVIRRMVQQAVGPDIPVIVCPKEISD